MGLSEATLGRNQKEWLKGKNAGCDHASFGGIGGPVCFGRGGGGGRGLMDISEGFKEARTQPL